ncbi:DUF3426 domain-containing protein [Dechloromonas sp. ZY10]|uniref:DUF3426 domain-containing protein n=1 Tax=Dechloromonas aquae TaxID=2664436 RepID=UPI00352859F7
MSGRSQALMRTRCPVCGTIFRVTSEQLRLKAGKVRCGHCQALFNAFDSLMPDETPAPVPATLPEINDELVLRSQAATLIGRAVPDELLPVPSVEAIADAWHAAGLASLAPENEAPPELHADPEEVQAECSEQAATAAASAAVGGGEALSRSTAAQDDFPEASRLPEALPADVSDPLRLEPQLLSAPEAAEASLEPTFEPALASDMPAAATLETPAEMSGETPEQSTQAARDAGLVAARELSDTPAFNRWAAGTLANDGYGGFAPESARPQWPFVVMGLVLLLLLLAQAGHHFRSEIARKWPETEAIYTALGVVVPLPRNADLVAIETSDLQSDAQRGLFVLQATLKNRAAFRQAWPSLELTLTDTLDGVVTRRVLAPVEYLPPGTAAEFFAADSEIGIRLWLESSGAAAAGYRLYLFYP